MRGSEIAPIDGQELRHGQSAVELRQIIVRVLVRPEVWSADLSKVFFLKAFLLW